MVSCEVITDTNVKRTPIIGSCLPPPTLEHLPDLEDSLKPFRYQYTIVLGDLSADIGQAYNPRSHQVADFLMDFGLINLIHHFQQRWHYQHMKTWYREIQGRAMRERSGVLELSLVQM